MSTVLSVAIGVGVFVVAAIIYSKFIVNNATLATLPALEGEEQLFEEEGVTVKQVGSPRAALFINCKVRVTNQRIIVAQKALLSKTTFVLRLVATYTDPGGAGADLGRSLRSACVVASIPRDAIRLEGEGKEAALVLPLGGGALTQGQTMQIYSKRLPELRGVLSRGNG